MADVLVIDNYDSFTFNLVQEMGELGATVEVRRNDDVTVDDVIALDPDGIVLSPGPGRPEHAGVTCAVVREVSDRIPTLGVCLGHQAIGVVFGAEIVHAPTIMHGKTSAVDHDGVGLFEGLPNPLLATRYHSLVIDPATLGDELEPTAWSEGRILMGVRHKTRPLEGVQFHPESVLTVEGPRLLANFLARLN